MDRLVWQYAAWYAGCGFLGSFTGQLTLFQVVKRYKKQSWVVFLVAFAIVGCSIAIITMNIIGMVDHDVNMAFVGPCGSSPGNTTEEGGGGGG